MPGADGPSPIPETVQQSYPASPIRALSGVEAASEDPYGIRGRGPDSACPAVDHHLVRSDGAASGRARLGHASQDGVARPHRPKPVGVVLQLSSEGGGCACGTELPDAGVQVAQSHRRAGLRLEDLVDRAGKRHVGTSIVVRAVGVWSVCDQRWVRRSGEPMARPVDPLERSDRRMRHGAGKGGRAT